MESFTNTIGLVDGILNDKYDHENCSEKQEPEYEHVKNWDKDPDDNWEGSVLIFKRLSDGKYFKAEYVMRFDGEIRSCSDYAEEVQLKTRTVEYFE